MVRRLSPRQRIEALVDAWEPQIRTAFLAGIADLRANAEVARIVEALERGDLDSALRAVHLDPAVFRGLESAIGQAYGAGGFASTGSLPVLRDPMGGRVVLRFDARNPRAESWLSSHSSRLVTAIVDDQRTAIRAALASGMEAGTNPRTTALDVVGRLNRASGRREGGIIGLTGPQERFVANARADLRSGDPARLRQYLTRERRDRRFDGQVLRAIRDGKPIDAATVQHMTGRYADRLLQLRGEMLARTESMAAIHAAQDEAFRQAIDSGAVAQQDVKRTWRTASDARVRDSHVAMEGETAGMDLPFSNGLLYPGDPSGPPEEIIGCRCSLTIEIDFLGQLAREEAA